MKRIEDVMQHKTLKGLFSANLKIECGLPFTIRALILLHPISYVSFIRGKKKTRRVLEPKDFESERTKDFI